MSEHNGEWPELPKEPIKSNLPQRRVYRPEPTIKQFHASMAKKRIIVGPIGSGKSVGCVQEILRLARNQAPNIDGSRSTRWLVARDTEVTLKRTTISTWKTWALFGRMITTPPIRWEYNGPDPFGGKHPMDIVVYFIGLDGTDAINKLKSFEVTGVYLNEVDQLTKDIYDEAFSRAGRWPDKKSCPAGITWDGIFCDANPTDTDHWLYKMCEIEKPSDTEVFHQPPALLWSGVDWIGNPAAENITNLQKGYAYYIDLCKGKTNDWIRVYCCGEWGSARRDKPVYPEYDDSVHCAKENIKPMRGLPIIIGLDFGLNPSAVIAQVMPVTGQLRVIDELVSDGIGLEQFCRDTLRPLLLSTYAGMSVVAIGDPAGASRSSLDSTQTSYTTLARYGITARASHMIKTNTRLEAVKRLLITPCYVHEGTPPNQRLLLLSPKCAFLRKGFIERYRYSKTRVGDGGSYTTTIEDDITTHPHDCLQYIAGDYGLKLNVKQANGYGNDFPDEPRKKRNWSYL